ncbi:MAG: transcriptional repressor [Pseudodesulfovibrio sp.]|uniref:Ferric-uptake regulator n=1 Tax=Pseudodesulfovibrio aespoeensis (strain ATCC 700646 / DSM 10631 / Aspo-2) TaxID=643562 RepID=E6VQU5_PSEA9|nr:MULTISPECIES: transcriptional repressor [Pseudodesulfovibrio]MBU4192122.1 transcriptional repressor [Pseudomonadota bacterium]ADU61822.1 ferric-uptake regulator [Pseudodesulfovibrio aespoeensis Aspo-2]MBU4242812.1 transcriptional repressor [Pseudomonadota bacterium]MBU4380064.1 transcriptional repressor [Pseudomonadota bacterium]MBU4476606.1 transcriptional repressor [Pseudomonadota bacterium]
MVANMGFRLSKQRKVILEELRKVTSHPTADEVYDMVRKIIPRISLGTVYRNLEFLCTKGLAMKLGAPGAQKRFDGMAEPHPHIRCAICTNVVDVECDVILPQIPSECAAGYDILSTNVEFVGICPQCQAARQ